MLMKTIYLEPAWKQTLSVKDLLVHSPQGYQFITKEASQEKVSKLAAKMDFAYALQGWLGGMLPLNLAKAYLERFRRIPQGADLTYAVTHLVFRKEPWVLDMQCEQPHLLIWSERHFDRYKEALKRVLTSTYCRKIICWADAGRKAFLQMGCEELEDKIEVVHGAVIKRNFIKEYQQDNIKLLFVGSSNIRASRHFEVKGGKEIVEAFFELSKRHDNLELVVRSGMSQELKNKCSQLSNIKIIDKPIPWAELEQEWKSADIFVQPAHITPAVAFLDAMSYELPIVTTDAWANPEIVDDGRTGFLVPKSDVAQYIDNFVVHFDSPEYERVVKTIDPKMVAAIVDKISILVENEDLRRSMGKAGRWEIEHGKFSIEKRNEKLKKIFDEATA